MQQILLTKYEAKIEELNRTLGFSTTLFLERDFVLVDLTSEKKALFSIAKAKSSGLFTVAKPSSEDMLRFLLEKTAVDMVFGIESIHPKEHYHYLRAGLDHVLAKIASDKKKVIGFTLPAEKKLGRIMQNIRLCRKFGVGMCLLGEKVRSAQDLAALFRVLKGDVLTELVPKKT